MSDMKNGQSTPRVNRQRAALIKAWGDIQEMIHDFEPHGGEFDHQTGFYGRPRKHAKDDSWPMMSRKAIAQRFARIAKLAAKAATIAQQSADEEKDL